MSERCYVMQYMSLSLVQNQHCFKSCESITNASKILASHHVVYALCTRLLSIPGMLPLLGRQTRKLGLVLGGPLYQLGTWCSALVLADFISLIFFCESVACCCWLTVRISIILCKPSAKAQRSESGLDVMSKRLELLDLPTDVLDIISEEVCTKRHTELHITNEYR